MTTAHGVRLGNKSQQAAVTVSGWDNIVPQNTHKTSIDTANSPYQKCVCLMNESTPTLIVGHSSLRIWCLIAVGERRVHDSQCKYFLKHKATPWAKQLPIRTSCRGPSFRKEPQCRTATGRGRDSPTRSRRRREWQRPWNTNMRFYCLFFRLISIYVTYPQYRAARCHRGLASAISAAFENCSAQTKQQGDSINLGHD